MRKCRPPLCQWATFVVYIDQKNEAMKVLLWLLVVQDKAYLRSFNLHTESDKFVCAKNSIGFFQVTASYGDITDNNSQSMSM